MVPNVIPHPWPALVLALAAFRLARLVGWDTFPLAERFRDLVSGTETVTSGNSNARMGLTNGDVTETTTDRRPAVRHFLECAWCQGFWLSLGAYGAWLAEPRWALYGAAPFAISAFVGLVAKNLDP